MKTDVQPPPMRLSRWHERWLYAIGALVFVSGVGWLADHYLFAGSADFGDAHAAFEPLWLRLHGAAAMAGLVVLGSLLPGHITRAWRSRTNRRSGLLMLSIAVLLGRDRVWPVLLRRRRNPPMDQHGPLARRHRGSGGSYNPCAPRQTPEAASAFDEVIPRNYHGSANRCALPWRDSRVERRDCQRRCRTSIAPRGYASP